jgi:fructose-1,6-bisphosphatase/inositol monophosphatase family enzyme
VHFSISPSLNHRILEAFEKATAEAVAAIIPLHSNLTLGYKNSDIYRDGREIVTEADTLSDKVLSDFLSVRFHDIARVTEEQVKSHAISSETFFTIDGLDGTICFAGRYPGAESMWGILLGYVEKGEPQLGSIYLKATDQIITIDRRAGEIKIDGVIFPRQRYPEQLTIAIDLGSWQSANVENYVIPALQDAGIRCITDRPSAAGLADYLIRGKAHAWISRVARIWDVTPVAAAMYALGGVVEPLYQENINWVAPYPDPAIYACSLDSAIRIKEVLLSIPEAKRF